MSNVLFCPQFMKHFSSCLMCLSLMFSDVSVETYMNHYAVGCLLFQGEAFEWLSSSSKHAQTVAKAKYQFLFGNTEDKSTSHNGNNDTLQYSLILYLHSHTQDEIGGLYLCLKCVEFQH